MFGKKKKEEKKKYVPADDSLFEGKWKWKLLGEVIKLEELTATFDFVITESLECINEVINLKIKDKASWENRMVTTIGFREDRKRMMTITEASGLLRRGVVEDDDVDSGDEGYIYYI